MKNVDQFRLLLWKNYILQKRRPVATVVELLLPILFSTILVIIRNSIEMTVYSNITTWKKFNVSHLPPFESNVVPKDFVWNVAYVPKNNMLVDGIMMQVEQRLNTNLPKSEIEIKCKFDLDMFMGGSNSSRSGPNTTAALSSGNALPNRPPPRGNISSVPGRNPSGGLTGNVLNRSRVEAESTYKQLSSSVQGIVNETARKENMTAIELIMQVMRNGTINQFIASITEQERKRVTACISQELTKNIRSRRETSQNNTKNSTSSIPKNFLSMISRVPTVNVISFESEEALLEYAKNDTNLKELLAGVIFKGMTSSSSSIPDDLTITLRFHSEPINKRSRSDRRFTGISDIWETSNLFPEFQRSGPRSNNSKYGGRPGYYTEGFLSLMHAINMGLASTLTNSAEDRSGFDLKRYPYPPYIYDTYIMAIKNSLPMLIMLSFFYTSLVIVRSIVQEKESRMKEYMKMMGLSNWLHWLAWFLKYFLFLSISCIVMSGLYKIPTAYGCVLTHSSMSVILLFLLIFCIATINFCFLISSFFSKANVGATTGGVIYALSYMPYLFMSINFTSLSMRLRIFACLLSNVAMASGFNVIGLFEGKGTGIQWSNVNKGVTVDDNFTLAHVFGMLLFDAVWYFLLTIYIEGVWPGEYGVPKPWNFPFTKSYWFGVKMSESKCSLAGDTEAIKNTSTNQDDIQDKEYFEEEPKNLQKTVQIKGLRKVFKNGRKEKVAVRNLNLNMYDGQITVLLGHNGAGKTTTMSILTGFFPPTSGDAIVNGFSVRKDIVGVRQSLGLCPQFNILFDLLTVDEHLYFFSRLKGLSAEAAVNETNNMKKELKLEDKGSARSHTLSGGMKRKLSVGIALSAGSKYVILDEPTSGMDPAARRAIWEVLQNFRSRCSMLLSTHFMDEADLLGDRIAIMAEGKLRCSGSSVFLKNAFGVGYHVVLTKSESCDVNKLTKIMQSHVSEANLERSAGAELSYVLPFQSSSNFPKLFKTLEDESSHLGISGFGAVVTTMEEVFLRVTEDAEIEMKNVKEILSDKSTASRTLPIMPDETTESLEPPLNEKKEILNTALTLDTGTTLWLRQFYALLVKKVLHSRRNYKVAVAQLIVPIFFAVLAIINAKYPPFEKEIVPLDLTLDAYGPNNIYIDNPNSSQFGKIYFNQFQDSIEHAAMENSDLDTYFAHQYEKEGGSFNSDNIISASFTNSSDSNSTQAIAWFNNQGFHTPATSLIYLDQAYLRMVSNRNLSMHYINHPLPKNTSSRIQEQLIGGLTGFLMAFNIVLGFSFLAASFCLFLVRERVERAALLQALAGVDPVCFWMSAFVWDFINFMLPCFITMVMFAAFTIPEFTDHSGILLLIFSLYCWASLPLMYLLSLLFTVPSTALVRVTMLNVVTGLASLLTINILRALQLTDIASALNWFFLLMPSYCFGNGLADLYSNHKMVNACTTDASYESYCETLGINFQTNFLAFEEYGVGKYVLFLALQGIVFFIILFLIEFDVFMLLWRTLPSVAVRNLVSVESVNFDDDVSLERERINSSEQALLVESDRLIIKNLTKVYGKSFVAVNNLCIGVTENECFGLLGVNGAGKTSTFKMLTGDLVPTSGTAYLDGYNIRTQLRKVQQRMGYCPQFDALIDQMTGSETLRMYGRLRGVSEADIPGCIQNLGNTLHFSEHMDKQCGTYSGGNKRKLSTAIALIGNPPVVLLDEPSTGMDPGARRMLWDALTSVRTSGRSIVITSHSMEECEALCTRLAIMVNGTLRCIGGPQHLKNKFGHGYTVEIKALEIDVKSYMKENFPGSVLKDEHQNVLTYHVPQFREGGEKIKLAEVFEFMEKAKQEIHFGDYTVTQTTLEQVFLGLARWQRETNSTTSLS